MKIKKINSRNYFYLDLISHYKSDSTMTTYSITVLFLLLLFLVPLR